MIHLVPLILMLNYQTSLYDELRLISQSSLESFIQIYHKCHQFASLKNFTLTACESIDLTYNLSGFLWLDFRFHYASFLLVLSWFVGARWAGISSWSTRNSCCALACSHRFSSKTFDMDPTDIRDTKGRICWLGSGKWIAWCKAYYRQWKISNALSGTNRTKYWSQRHRWTMNWWNQQLNSDSRENDSTGWRCSPRGRGRQ